MLLSPMSVTNANSPTTGKITPTTTTKICLHPYTRNTEYAVLPIKRNLVDMNVLRSLNRKIILDYTNASNMIIFVVLRGRQEKCKNEKRRCEN
jgi:hypothetical protein